MLRELFRIQTMIRRRLLPLGLILALGLAFLPGKAQADSFPLVDLHAHFFFHEGTGLPLFGGFRDPVSVHSWKSRLLNKVNAEGLERSGVRLAVVALYSHPLFLLTQRNSIRRQIEEARQFVQDHPDWVIARSAPGAKAAIAAGKRVLVLSIEGASGTLDTDEDLDEFIGRDGVSIVTPLHFIDDAWGGPAFMQGAWLRFLDNPLAAVRAMLSPRDKDASVPRNSRGLEPHGREQIAKLLARGVWIDFSHASDAAQDDLRPLLLKAGQPLLYTHTVLRSALQAERGISRAQLLELGRSQGIIGILPSDDMLRGTKVAPRFCPARCHGKCTGGIPAFLSQVAQARAILAEQGKGGTVLLGSDIDAPLSFLGPACEEDTEALSDYSQLLELWGALDEYGLLDPAVRRDGMVAPFLEAWSRVKAGS